MTGGDVIVLAIICVLTASGLIGLVSVYRWTANLPGWLAGALTVGYAVAVALLVGALTGTLPEMVR